jgi:hypothetical protein
MGLHNNSTMATCAEQMEEFPIGTRVMIPAYTRSVYVKDYSTNERNGEIIRHRHRYKDTPNAYVQFKVQFNGSSPAQGGTDDLYEYCDLTIPTPATWVCYLCKKEGNRYERCSNPEWCGVMNSKFTEPNPANEIPPSCRCDV